MSRDQVGSLHACRSSIVSQQRFVRVCQSIRGGLWLMDAVKVSYYRQMDDINCNKSPSRFCALVIFKKLHDALYSIMKVQCSKKIIYFELYVLFSSKYILYKLCYFVKLIYPSFFPFFLLFECWKLFNIIFDIIIHWRSMLHDILKFVKLIEMQKRDQFNIDTYRVAILF